MPRYFFDINDGREIRDEIGRELTGATALKAEAMRTVALLLARQADNAVDNALILSVRDDSGSIPLKVRVACQLEEL